MREGAITFYAQHGSSATAKSAVAHLFNDLVVVSQLKGKGKYKVLTTFDLNGNVVVLSQVLKSEFHFLTNKCR